MEMNFGCREGQRWDAMPQAAFDDWMADFGKHRFGGQMSVHGFMQQVAGAWDDFRLQGVDAVWITHAGVIRAARLLASGVRQVTQAQQWPQAAPDFGGWCEIDCAERPA
jgi:alpha-ribazole phosphatase